MADRSTPEATGNLSLDSNATWQDEREARFNAEVHGLLDAAADAIDEPGPLASARQTLEVVERLRAKLIAECGLRSGSSNPEAIEDEADDLIASEAWARNGELRRVDRKLTIATQALIHTRSHMIDRDDDAYAPIVLVEDSLVEIGEMLGAVLKAIDPDGEPKSAAGSGQPPN